jgi:deferrochelatase/peroxidase EfeB
MQLPELDLTRSKVDINEAAFVPMLEDLQANILKSHGRESACRIFPKLNSKKIPDAKKWISGFGQTWVTSARKLEQGRLAYKATGADGGAVFTLSISATGYSALGSKLPQETETSANAIPKVMPES